MRPELSRVPEFYHKYINEVPQDDIMEAFKNESSSLIHFLETIPADKSDYRYGPDKWTIKEVLQHVIDAERVFCYRALCFARRDPAPLPGFDENIFGKNAKADTRQWNDLLEEFKIIRKGSEILFHSFDQEQLDATGIANNHSNYVLGFGYVLIGHSLHHQKILKQRYL